MGRPEQFGEGLYTRVPRGTLATISEVLRAGETQAGFVRAVLAREIARRQQPKAKRKASA